MKTIILENEGGWNSEGTVSLPWLGVDWSWKCRPRPGTTWLPVIQWHGSGGLDREPHGYL